VRVQIGTQPPVSGTGTHLRLLQHGVELTIDGRTATLDIPMERIARESTALLRAATAGLSDETFLAYGAASLHFELFFNLAKVSLALEDHAVSQATLMDGLAIWQRGSSRFRDLRVATHHAALRGYALADAPRPEVPPSGSPRWVFLWGRPSQNRSLALLRKECDEHRDLVADLGMNIRLLTKAIRSTSVPAPWHAEAKEMWKLRQLPLADALFRATTLARSICRWARSWKGVELDERSLVRVVLYDVVLGDSLERYLTRTRPEALVCSMAWGMAYQAAYRAQVRCVEFVHGSVEEGLSQPAVPRAREIVGANSDDLAWLEERSTQRYVSLSTTDPAIEHACRRRELYRSDGTTRVAYFPTYTAAVFGGASTTREKEDQIVRAMVEGAPSICWKIKPHPSDTTAASRFDWARPLRNVELLPASVDALELLVGIDAAVHCGSSLSRPIAQLGIPQLELVLEGRALSTAMPQGTTSITSAEEGIQLLRALPPGASIPSRPERASLRARVLLSSKEPSHA